MKPEDLGAYYESILENEVRKEGGIYYTPPFIVDYIVKHTLGELLKGKTPKEAEKIKIVDPSCGAGVFLLGAYQFLLDWYQKQLGTLTFQQRKQILINNIFGVDIDENAVEITKLCLLIKCLGGETTASIENTLRLFQEKVLPNIDGNVRCGNSLIGTDFYAMSNTEFSTKEQLKINAFDWELEFPQIMKSGGFDVVIGNPPWEVVIGKEFKKNLKHLTCLNNYYKHTYKEVQGETNLYRLFIERIITKLLAAQGRWGYIMPSSLLNDKSASRLRKLFINSLPFIEINHFPEKARVFKHVTQDVCIYLFSHVRSLIRVRSGLLSAEDYIKPFIALSKNLVSQLDKIPFVKSKPEADLLQKLSANKTFEQQNVIRFYEGEIHLTKFADTICAKQTRQSIYPLVRGDAVQRYVLRQSEKDSFVNEKTALMISNAPKMQDCNRTRLVYQQVVNMQKNQRLNFYLLESKIYVANTCGYAVLLSENYNIRFLLGLLNSNLLNWRYKLTSSNNHILTNELDKLPFPHLDLSKKPDKEQHDQLVSLVNDMLKFKHQESTAILRQKEIIQRRIAATDLMINQLVYRLYGLTAEEIAIVEDAYKPH